MTDLSSTIAPKSDQLNTDDLIAGEKTIKITKVAKKDSAEQPISIYFDGDNGRPYKPCKSMRRVLVQVWGKDGSLYIGRSLTIYRDKSVRFGGVDVGGIRISHVSHIDKPITLALSASKTSRKPYTVKPLEVTPEINLADLLKTANETAAKGSEELKKWWGELTASEKSALKPHMDELKIIASNIEK